MQEREEIGLKEQKVIKHIVFTPLTRSLLQIHSFKNLPPLLNMSLNAFLLDFDFLSFFIGLTRNSHAFGFKLIRPVSIVTLKFDD